MSKFVTVNGTLNDGAYAAGFVWDKGSLEEAIIESEFPFAGTWDTLKIEIFDNDLPAANANQPISEMVETISRLRDEIATLGSKISQLKITTPTDRNQIAALQVVKENLESTLTTLSRKHLAKG